MPGIEVERTFTNRMASSSCTAGRTFGRMLSCIYFIILCRELIFIREFSAAWVEGLFLQKYVHVCICLKF